MRMKRKDALTAIRVAGYHGDSDAAMLAYVENRVSRKTFECEWASGVEARQNGMPCNCHQCKAEMKGAA